MSHYGGGYRQGGDLYRPGNARQSRGYGAGPGSNGSNYRGSSYGRSDQTSSYRSAPPGRQNLPAQASRHQAKPQNNAYHLVYSQTQSEHQLWQGDLDAHWTEQLIMDLWRQVGENPVSVKLIRDKMGKPQYCFVTFTSHQAVASAIQKNRMQVPGSSRTFKLNWASGGSHGDSRAPPGRDGGSRYAGSGQGSRSSAEYSIFVGDLDLEVSEPTLFARFSKEYPGAVKQVKIMTDPASGASKGFGFVRFFTESAQQSALKDMNGVVIGERPIRVGLASGGNQDTSASLKKGKDALPVVLAQKQPPLTPYTDPNNTVVIVRGISSSITAEELKAHFLAFGSIVYCRVNYQKHVAHIKFLLRGAATRAVLFLTGFVINGCRLTIGWGREENVADGKLQFRPVDKSVKYTAAPKPPVFYGKLPYSVVFEDLSREEVSKLNFASESDAISPEQLDQQVLEQKIERNRYLELAF